MIVSGSYVYFASCHALDGYDLGVVKIGLSHEPGKRLGSVRMNTPFRLRFVCSAPGDMFYEFFVHMWLRATRVTGEYFAKSDELTRIVDHVKTTGRLPFPIKEVPGDVQFKLLRPLDFMQRHRISFRDLEKEAGVTTQSYRRLLERAPEGNRRFLAALAVTAVRRGLSIEWPRDFIPSPDRLAS
ncbi:hypothetical protein [Mesorhizobium sp. Z1-4]|uniref:hypothetical protein n=1 Tax=Mesorhizobium sp. Z1-4 TaxID=2448478 RepID=UPI000FDB2227|nr:hypothetical protein [Mesorhizobium sp. Z1-4]